MTEMEDAWMSKSYGTLDASIDVLGMEARDSSDTVQSAIVQVDVQPSSWKGVDLRDGYLPSRTDGGGRGFWYGMLLYRYRFLYTPTTQKNSSISSISQHPITKPQSIKLFWSIQ